ncbi:hypothetical protein NZD89_23140 [Alicyclobacillus fastidiosus]|uniref:Uncharacterized protein n=1 Tax=Alicyclobacillus fastidiosus TaxID=392011 RepID=A0ABY6ZE48_9BACL|nr:hypothetical protein [Alicyclobacillus fastidiosus]WAH41131.1 hypothetical protein NZD89_23140 [Alicyclobacillus fastidiosus]GMA62692.1 hypothetical protein GCM10025859_31320 [Alicyclobacillus fastidiosus]
MNIDLKTFQKLVLLAKEHPKDHPYMVRSLLHGFAQEADVAQWSVAGDAVNKLAQEHALPKAVREIVENPSLSEDDRVHQAFERISAVLVH